MKMKAKTKTIGLVATSWLLLAADSSFAASYSITIDDPNLDPTPRHSPAMRDKLILQVLEGAHAKVVLFVCGMRVTNEKGTALSKEGTALLKAWDRRGHWIANHTFSHLDYHATEFDDFSTDVLKVEPLLKDFSNFRRYFRFPFLREGDTLEKRDQMRAFLKTHGYSHGYVTISTSDWYIDQRMIDRLKKKTSTDVGFYRDIYLKHVLENALYYDELAQEVFGKQIHHTLLIHHNLLNALFLGDLIAMFRNKGWRLVDPSVAFKKDGVFQLEPDTVPAGEGFLLAAAKAKENFVTELRYPAADTAYLKDEIDAMELYIDGSAEKSR